MTDSGKQNRVQQAHHREKPQDGAQQHHMSVSKVADWTRGLGATKPKVGKLMPGRQIGGETSSNVHHSSIEKEKDLPCHR